VTLVINPAVGCYYFLLSPRLPSKPESAVPSPPLVRINLCCLLNRGACVNDSRCVIAEWLAIKPATSELPFTYCATACLLSAWNSMATRMWTNAQRDGRPAEYRWRPLLNVGWRPLLHCVPNKWTIKLIAVTLSNLNRFSKFFHC